ncbi:hypothetical protein B0H16DRAFT_1459966 [Mycena metata]|uniref:Peroxidase n=1 Tax=Mycena metata TaxID=1033252 RepID=A0AAD7IZ49_9AGAR|nr:hypothetical protein B0H16DRAFT_1459966 [Mycena metata]
MAHQIDVLDSLLLPNFKAQPLQFAECQDHTTGRQSWNDWNLVVVMFRPGLGLKLESPGFGPSRGFWLVNFRKWGPGLAKFQAEPEPNLSEAGPSPAHFAASGQSRNITKAAEYLDATEAGPATVPEPQQDLASHVASFKAQGFNEAEMIGLVACGHSLGGVRQADFPLIVTGDAPTGIQNFASTVGFDNTVVKEYLDGTTENVLVVGPNVTTRSDLRIFPNDGNVTMQSLASPDTFNQVCADLIGRMIDTVPSTVTLTDPVEPFDFKVWNTLLFPQGGSLAFLATLRIIDTGLNRTVTMFWKERTGTFCPTAGCSIPSFQVTTEDATALATLKSVNAFKLHSFNATVDLATSISHFWFEVNDNDGSTPFIVDNHGANYTIDQDVLLFDPRRSSFTPPAVKDFSTGIKATARTTVSGNDTVPVASSVTTTFELDSSHPPGDGYTFYAAHVPRGTGTHSTPRTSRASPLPARSARRFLLVSINLLNIAEVPGDDHHVIPNGNLCSKSEVNIKEGKVFGSERCCMFTDLLNTENSGERRIIMIHEYRKIETCAVHCALQPNERAQPTDMFLPLPLLDRLRGCYGRRAAARVGKNLIGTAGSGKRWRNSSGICVIVKLELEVNLVRGGDFETERHHDAFYTANIGSQLTSARNQRQAQDMDQERGIPVSLG